MIGYKYTSAPVMALTFLLLLIMSPAQGATMAPDGNVVAQVGPNLFKTDHLTVQQTGGRLIIEAATNYHPWPDYNIADVHLTIGTKTMAVKLSGPRRGDIILNPTWNTSEIFAQADIPYGRHLTGDYIPVQACRGQTIGQADISLTDTGWRLAVPLKSLPGTGHQNIKVTWGTAFCGNSLAEIGGEVILAAGEAPWGGPVASLPYCADPQKGHGSGMFPAGYGNFPGPVFPWDPGGGGCGPWTDIIYPCQPHCPPPSPVPLPGGFLLLLTGLIRMVWT